jgi:hypothetical protein
MGYDPDQLPTVEACTNEATRDFLVLTHGGADRRYKDCKCARCHKIAQCTPTNDFYTISGDNNGPLYCEMCFRSVVYLKDNPQLDTP